MHPYQNNRGFIRFLLIIGVVIVVLSYYNFDLRGAVESPQTEANFGYIFDLWNNYIWGPAQSLAYLLIDFIKSMPSATPQQ